MKRIFFGIAFIATLIVVSCSKTENPTTGYLTYTKYNLAGKYMVTGLTFKKDNEGIEYDVYGLDSVYKECKKDDVLNFDTNFVFSYIDSTGKICDSFDVFDQNQYTILNTNVLSGIRTFEPASWGYQTYQIQSLTANSLILGRHVIFPLITGNIEGNVKVTLTRKP